MKTSETKKREIANMLIESMETAGTGFMLPWVKSGMPMNLSRLNTKDPYYYGINNLILWREKSFNKYKSNVWGTFKQIKDKGGMVLKGEHAIDVVLWKPFQVTDTYKKTTTTHKAGDKYQKTCFYIEFFKVFNMDQTTLKDEYAPNKNLDGAKTKVDVEKYIANTKAVINHGGDRCFYVPSQDYIQMVEKSDFKSTGDSNATQNYYSTLLHELTHWTGHKKRCDRDMQGYFGDDSYAFEELVAEIGAAVQCCILGITSTPKKESAQYLKSWIKRIKDDPDALFKASAKANQAVKFIEELQENKKQIVKDPELKADKNKVAWIQKVSA